MSTEIDIDSDDRSGELTDDIVTTAIAQGRGGSVQVSIPKAGAEDLGIEEGDSVLITGQQGDSSLELQPSGTVFSDQ